MEKMKVHSMDIDAIGRIIKEGQGKVYRTMRSEAVKILMADIELIQGKPEYFFWPYLEKALEIKPWLKGEIDEFDERYRLDGDRGKRFTFLARGLKTLNCRSIYPDDTIFANIMCTIMQIYYFETCEPEDLNDKIITVIRFQLACGLTWAICDLEDHFDSAIEIGREQDRVKTFVSIIYKIKGAISALEFVDVLEVPLVSSVMILEGHDGTARRLETIETIENILEQYTVRRKGPEYPFDIHLVQGIPVHSDGMVKIGMPELFVDQATVLCVKNRNLICDVYDFLKKPKNTSKLVGIKYGETIKITLKDLKPGHDIDKVNHTLCLIRRTYNFVEAKEMYGPRDIGKDIWFIEIYADDDAPADKHSRDDA